MEPIWKYFAFSGKES